MDKPRLLLIVLCGARRLGTGGPDAAAVPRHDICADVGDTFAFGVSSFGSLRDWAPPDLIRASGALGTPPPAGNPAGGGVNPGDGGTPPPDESGDSGCGCRTTDGPGPAPLPVLLFVALLFVRWRRSRVSVRRGARGGRRPVRRVTRRLPPRAHSRGRTPRTLRSRLGTGRGRSRPCTLAKKKHVRRKGGCPGA